jgi:hypothetical protein
VAGLPSTTSTSTSRRWSMRGTRARHHTRASRAPGSSTACELQPFA